MSGPWLRPKRENERDDLCERFRQRLKEMVRDNVECPVCLKRFETGKGVAALLECGHILCADCYIQLIVTIDKRHTEVEPEVCPYCKVKMLVVLDLPIPTPAPRILLPGEASGEPAHADAAAQDNEPQVQDDVPEPEDTVAAAQDNEPQVQDAVPEPADNVPTDADDDGNTTD